MKIKVKKISYNKLQEIPSFKYFKPVKQSFVLKTLVRIMSSLTLRGLKFKYITKDLDRLSKKEPFLILMNHSSFLDLKIAFKILRGRRFNIVTSDDAFVGKKELMRHLGCIPARKYIADTQLVKDMHYTLNKLKQPLLMFPEASYSIDGTSTTLPDAVGKCLKFLKVPVVIIKTYGAFLHDPLYNKLQTRKVKVTAEIKYLLSPDDIKEKSVDELNEIIRSQFTFDNFKHQQENNIYVGYKFRADHLNKVLYKCPHCDKEGRTYGMGTRLSCIECGNTYELTEYGFLKNLTRTTIFNHIPDWYKWQREEVKKEIENGTYEFFDKVKIYAMKDYKSIYELGYGTLTHNMDGFKLESVEMGLTYTQAPLVTYSLNSDFHWYEIGDVITLGTKDIRYFCIPKTKLDMVAKIKLATEELYNYYLKQKQHN